MCNLLKLLCAQVAQARMQADQSAAAARNSAAQAAALERAVAEQRKAAAALFGPDPQAMSPSELAALEERHRAALQRIHALQVCELLGELTSSASL